MSVNESSFRALLSHSGLKVRMFFSKHPLKQPDHLLAVFQDQPIPRSISGEGFETEHLVEAPRGLNVLDRQADRKGAEFDALTLNEKKLPAIYRKELLLVSIGAAGFEPTTSRPPV